VTVRLESEGKQKTHETLTNDEGLKFYKDAKTLEVS
jgi:hypothetical protein